MTVPHTRRRDSLTSPAHRGHSAKLKLHKPAVRSVVIIQISRELILLSLMVRRRNLPPRSLRLAVLSQPVTHPSWPVFETHPSIQIVIRSPVSKEKLSSKQHELVKIMTTTAGSLPLLSFYFGFWLLDVCYYGSIETALATSCATISPSNSTHRRRLAAAIQGADYHITSGFESLFYAFSYVSEEPLS